LDETLACGLKEKNIDKFLFN